jgi:hypothetical protein
MYLEELKKLYISMRENDIDIQKFLISHNGIDFAVTYSLRVEPHTLSLTSLNENRVFVKFEVKKGFYISPCLENEVYKKLANLFRNNIDSFVPFVIKNFLQEIKSSFPSQATTNNIPNNPQDVLQGRRDIEEEDKIYFVGWTHHNGRGYSDENLYKTTLAFGQGAREYQIENNASSRWSDIPTDRNTWHPN